MNRRLYTRHEAALSVTNVSASHTGKPFPVCAAEKIERVGGESTKKICEKLKCSFCLLFIDIRDTITMSAWDNSAGKPSIHLSCREKNEHKLTGELGTKASQLGEEKRKTRVWMSLVLTPYACAGRSPIHRDVLPCRKAPQVGGDDERP